MNFAQRKSPEDVLNQIASAVPQRTAPQCRHFRVCGGCQLQHLPASEQLAAKQAMLVEVLRQSGVTVLPPVQVHGAEPYHYRNRVRLRVQGDAIGYNKRASNEFLPIEECPIAAEDVASAAFHLRDMVRSGTAQWPASTAAFELFANDDGSAMQLSLQVDATVNTVDREAPAKFRRMCDALLLHVPQLVGAGLSVAGVPDRTQSKRVQSSVRVEIARWGAPSLQYSVLGRGYNVSRNAFFQVNRQLTATMVDLVLADRRGGTAWDLFAGAGLFSAALTARFARVVAVEIGEPAVSDLLRHMQRCGPQHSAVCSTTLAFLQTQTAAARPDLVVLDPPRAGLGPAVTTALLRIAPRAIVYVSCDAGTFAVDAAALVKSGYTLASLHLLDLFPQTFHTETIAVFSR